MSRQFKNRQSGAPGQGASKTSVDRGALADLVSHIHRQLDASQPPKVRGRPTYVMPPLVEILASMNVGARGDAGESPEVLSS
ncbi:hypothetical protein MKK64_19925 [Methylobacterium sp. E-025]|uniref:hypothetical protein n=1 Tax=Methylobacterium sp. E-025 TaxID=2836561 RepID=UPI001FBBA538|nr:hypothetical protein [Methylobacterium sp. E-025]MCJ2113444.1 hypothetical protein [Methylobacterium sp. E-025]